MPIYHGVCAALTIPVVIVNLGLGYILAIPVFAISIIGSLALGIIGASKAANGEHFDYRISKKIIK